MKRTQITRDGVPLTNRADLWLIDIWGFVYLAITSNRKSLQDCLLDIQNMQQRRFYYANTENIYHRKLYFWYEDAAYLAARWGTTSEFEELVVAMKMVDPIHPQKFRFDDCYTIVLLRADNTSQPYHDHTTKHKVLPGLPVRQKFMRKNRATVCLECRLFFIRASSYTTYIDVYYDIRKIDI